MTRATKQSKQIRKQYSVEYRTEALALAARLTYTTFYRQLPTLQKYRMKLMPSIRKFGKLRIRVRPPVLQTTENNEFVISSKTHITKRWN